MDRNSVEFAKLKLLAASRKRLDFALSGQWEQLESEEHPWQSLLAEMLEKFGDELQSISAQLIADNDQLLSLLKRQQTVLNKEKQIATGNLSKVQKYLK